MGAVIPGTRFVSCKVPLKETMVKRLKDKERFSPEDLMNAYPKLSLVVDLTNTKRYYSSDEFTDNNIEYQKIFCPGRVVPPNSIVERFFAVVDNFLDRRRASNPLIAVHCTHGVNRTGYFICRYMIQKLGMAPKEAVKKFEAARGHKIERSIYVEDLMGGCKGGSESNLRFIQKGGNRPHTPMMKISTQTYNGPESKKAGGAAGKKKSNRPENFIIHNRKNFERSRSNSPVAANRKMNILGYFSNAHSRTNKNEYKSRLSRFDCEIEERERSPSPVTFKFTWTPIDYDEEQFPSHTPVLTASHDYTPHPVNQPHPGHQMPQTHLILQLPPGNQPSQTDEMDQPPLIYQMPPPGYPPLQTGQMPQPHLIHQMPPPGRRPPLLPQPPLIQQMPPGYPPSQTDEMLQPPLVHQTPLPGRRPPFLRRPPLIHELPPGYPSSQTEQMPEPPLIHKTPLLGRCPPLLPKPPLVNQMPSPQTDQMPDLNLIIQIPPPGHYPPQLHQAPPVHQHPPGYQTLQNRPPPCPAWQPRPSHSNSTNNMSPSKPPFSEGYRRLFIPQHKTQNLATNSKSPNSPFKAEYKLGQKKNPDKADKRKNNRQTKPTTGKR